MTVLDELRMHPLPVHRRGWNPPASVRLALAAFTMATLLIGANLATPLYAMLQTKLHLGPLGIAIAFATYVLVLIAGLLLVGHWSNHMGRRAPLILAVLLGIAGDVIFSSATGLGMLCLGRAIQGACVALATGASSAALRDLFGPRTDLAARLTLLASAGGVAAGPVIGGLLSQLTGPTSTPYILHAAVLLLLLIPLLVLRAHPAIAPVDAGRALATLRPIRPRISRHARGQFWLAAAIGFISFAVFGFCLSLAPTYFAHIAGTSSRPLIGILAALLLAASALSQLSSLRGRLVVPLGLGALGIGILLIALAGGADSLLLLTIGALLGGLGQGTAFRMAFDNLARLVEPELYAQVISAVYIVTYLGSAVPVVGLGAAVAVWGLPTALNWFAVMVASCCAILACGWLVMERRQLMQGHQNLAVR